MDKHDLAFYESLNKEAEEAAVVPGANPDPPPPEDRTTGLDAHWGDEPGPPLALSKEVAEAIREERDGTLKRLFSSEAAASGVHQATVGQQLEHGKGGQFESMSPMLTDKAKQASVETLVEQAMRVCGQR